QPRRGQDHHRSLAAVLQHREATLVAWIQATGTRGHHLACASKRSSTVICPGNSPKADHELRLKPDHPMGSGHKGAPVLIERKAVEVLRAKVQATLNMTAARRAIGTSKPVARAILRSGLIQPATGPAAILVGRDCWDAVEITNFLTRLEARIKPLCGAKNFCFSHALGLARNVGVGPVELLNLISMRGVRGAYQGNARSLNSLRLSSEDVERVLGLAADISVPALAARLRIKQQVA